jgi:hypothetical protein
MSDDLKKIYNKYFTDSGDMKQSGKDVLKKTGINSKSLDKVLMSGKNPYSDLVNITNKGPKTLTERGVFLPKAKDVAVKAAKASKYGKIAAGVAGAGLALKSYLKSKMTAEDVDKKYMGGPVMKAYKGKMTNIISEDKEDPHYKAAEVRGKRFDKKFKKYAMSKESQLHAKDFDKGLDIAESRAAKEVAYDAGYIDQVNQMSMGGETKLSPKQMKIARMAPPPDKITGADFKAMKASNGKMVMARGCKMGKNKPTKLS